jgi:Putative Flp pilus-assembly TadE/G-like
VTSGGRERGARGRARREPVRRGAGGDRAESGQAALLLLGVLAAILAGTLVLFGFGQALGTRGKHQRAADLAAVSAAQVMRDNYPRLFEPAFLRAGAPNPRHLSTAAYLAPTRVTVSLRGGADIRLAAGRPPDRVEVQARATAELIPGDDLGVSGQTARGGYSGPLAYRQGKPTPHLLYAL